MYPQYRVWRKEGLRDEDGILVAADLGQEWMLPWWWDHYSKQNNYPVTFVDFGMTREAREWCRFRGECVSLPVANIFVAEQEEIDQDLTQDWEKHFGKNFWSSRSAWFKKPLACLQSPFRNTLWLDLDCEVRGAVSSFFSFSDHPSGIALGIEPWSRNANPIYNSGVIVFKSGLSLIETWALNSFTKNHQFRGDQELLSHLIAEQKIVPSLLPECMNWSRCNGENPDALICHWQGEHAHRIIRNQVSSASLNI